MNKIFILTNEFLNYIVEPIIGLMDKYTQRGTNESEQPQELGIGALVSEDVKRINPDETKKDYTEHVYFAWQYFGVVVLSWFLLRSIQ